MNDKMRNINEKILVTRSSMPELTEYVDEIKELWDTHWLTNMGVKHRTLQSELEKYLGVPHIELLTNGHMALEMAIQAFDFPTGAEVITTPYTFASTTHAIVRNGLVPVFCDINEEDFTIDVNKIETLITDKTVAILPVHVYGNICDHKSIEEIAAKHSLKVIYDAAHAFGETIEGTGIGNLGDVSCFSFHATKVYNTIEGGAVAFKDPEYGRKIYTLKNFGIKDEEIIDGVGANAKMNEFCAAMGICNLRHIDEAIAGRKRIYEKYCEGLADISGISINRIADGLKYNYAYFPILVYEDVFGSDRDSIREKLMENGIVTRKYFYPITTEFDCYKGKYPFDPASKAKKISQRVLTLPIYPDLPEEIVVRICDLIREMK